MPPRPAAGCGTTAATAEIAAMRSATPAGSVACTVELSSVGSSSAVAVAEYTAAAMLA